MGHRRRAGLAHPVGGTGDPPNADLTRDIRVIMQLDPASLTDGTYYLYPGSKAGGDPYFGGDLGDMRTGHGLTYQHPFNALATRNGWLNIEPWIPGTCDYDGSLTAGGATLGDTANGGALGNSSLSGPDGIASLRTMIQGMTWYGAGPVLTGTDRLILADNVFLGDYADYKTNIFDVVCAELGVPIVTNPPNTSPYQTVYDIDLMKRQANYDGLRLQTTNFGATLTPCTRIRQINNDYKGYTNDGNFIGDIASRIFRRGCRFWDINHGSHGALFDNKWHSDNTQLTGGQDLLDFDYELNSGTDNEISAETSNIHQVLFGTKTGLIYHVWMIGMKSACVIVDASNGFTINSGQIRFQWFGAGSSPFNSGYDASFDTDFIVLGSPTITRDALHLLPSGVATINGGKEIEDVERDVVPHVDCPPNIFRANPVNASGTAITPNTTDAICTAFGLFD